MKDNTVLNLKESNIRQNTTKKDRLYTCLLFWNLVYIKFDQDSRVSAHNEKITAIGYKASGASPASDIMEGNSKSFLIHSTNLHIILILLVLLVNYIFIFCILCNLLCMVNNNNFELIFQIKYKTSEVNIIPIIAIPALCN